MSELDVLIKTINETVKYIETSEGKVLKSERVFKVDNVELASNLVLAEYANVSFDKDSDVVEYTLDEDKVAEFSKETGLLTFLDEDLYEDVEIEKEDVIEACEELKISDWTKKKDSKVLLKEAKIILKALKTKHSDIKSFKEGLEIELEHGMTAESNNVTGNHPLITGKIALVHLQEDKDYYTKLKAMETKSVAEGLEVYDNGMKGEDDYKPNAGFYKSIVMYGKEPYKKKAWEKFIKLEYTLYDLTSVVEYGPEPYKKLAWDILNKNKKKLDYFSLKSIINNCGEPYADLAWNLIIKKKK